MAGKITFWINSYNFSPFWMGTFKNGKHLQKPSQDPTYVSSNWSPVCLYVLEQDIDAISYSILCIYPCNLNVYSCVYSRTLNQKMDLFCGFWYLQACWLIQLLLQHQQNLWHHQYQCYLQRKSCSSVSQLYICKVTHKHWNVEVVLRNIRTINKVIKTWSILSNANVHFDTRIIPKFLRLKILWQVWRYNYIQNDNAKTKGSLTKDTGKTLWPMSTSFIMKNKMLRYV